MFLHHPQAGLVLCLLLGFATLPVGVVVTAFQTRHDPPGGPGGPTVTAVLVMGSMIVAALVAVGAQVLA